MLSPMDVQVDSHTSPTRMSVHLRQSKTDQFGAETTIHLGTTGSPLCPVTAMFGYLALRPPSPGPLFIHQDGSTLSRGRHIYSLREALRAAGVKDSGFSRHSFRIGAATAAAQAGVSDSLIQTLGRWKSSAFTLWAGPRGITQFPSATSRSRNPQGLWCGTGRPRGMAQFPSATSRALAARGLLARVCQYYDSISTMKKKS